MMRQSKMDVFHGLLVLCMAVGQSMAFELPGPPAACSSELRERLKWGVATSSYQIEGAWNVDGKGLNVWDVFSHTPGITWQNQTGDVAADHYHRFKEDIALMKELGIRHYRLSVSWARIVPLGCAACPVEKRGINWYKNLVKELLAAGIEPAVTLYHWDLPQALQQTYGGFMNRAIVADFVRYADVMFNALAPLGVKKWMTFNEVISICELGYQAGVFAPGFMAGLNGKYQCGHNVLLAHGRAYRLYERKYLPKHGGEVSIALDGKWGIPFSNSTADKAAADAFMVFQYAWMADPLYFGHYPELMVATQGTLLPTFTRAEKKMLKGTMDYFAMNFYTSYYVSAPTNNLDPTMVYNYSCCIPNQGPGGIPPGDLTTSAWLFKTPSGFRNALKWISDRYNRPDIRVTENGVSGWLEEAKPLPGVLNDTFRQQFYSDYLDDACKAIEQDGVNLTTYYAWSFIDNFEWRDAFSKRFGIVYIDLNGNLTRHPKLSAHWLSQHFFKVGQ